VNAAVLHGVAGFFSVVNAARRHPLRLANPVDAAVRMSA